MMNSDSAPHGAVVYQIHLYLSRTKANGQGILVMLNENPVVSGQKSVILKSGQDRNRSR